MIEYDKESDEFGYVLVLDIRLIKAYADDVTVYYDFDVVLVVEYFHLWEDTLWKVAQAFNVGVN